MCGGGGGKSQTVYQQQLPGPLTDRMAAAADNAANLAATPFQAYSAPRVAGLGAQQGEAAATFAGMAGYQPQQVGSTNATAATVNAPGGWSIEGRDLSGYTNPWEDAVVRTTMADLDREGRRAAEAAAGRAATAGAWGGSGAGVEQVGIQDALLRQKASAIAGLRSAGFARAQDLASQDVTRGLGLATTEAGFEQQAGLANAEAANRAELANQQADLAAQGVRQAGAQSLWQAGAAEQQTRQAEMDVAYDEFLRAINDPFQKQQFAIGALTGVSPSFSTSSQTTRLASPNPWNAAAGVAAIGAGLASFAGGGDVEGYWGGGGGGTLARPVVDESGQPVPTPSDPDLARLVESLRDEDDPVAAFMAETGAPPVRVPQGAGVPMEDRRVPLLGMPGEPTPAEEQIALAGVPVERGRQSLRPQIAGLGEPLPMPSPAAYSVPTEDSQVVVRDPVLAARYAQESGGNLRAVNQRSGASGAGQYMPSRLVDLGVYQPAEGEVLSRNGRAAPAEWRGTFSIPGLPGVRTQQDFLQSREAQETVERLNRAWEDRTIRALGLDRFVGQRVAGIDVAEADLRHALHFAGADGAMRFFSTGGRYNPSDGNRTVSEYLQVARSFAPGGAGARLVAQQQGPRQQAPRGGVPGDVVPASSQQGAAGGEGGGGQQQAVAGIPPEPEALDWWGRVRRGFRDPAHPDSTLPMGLIASGLGMLASPSPHFQNAVGQGGLMGMQFLQQARQTRSQDEAARAQGAYRAASLDVARRRAAAAEETARRTGRVQGTTRYLTPEEVSQRGYRPGTVVTETTGPDGTVTGAQVEQQPRERQLPQGWEEDPDQPGGVRRMRGFNEGRPLVPQAIRELSEAGSLVSTTARLRNTFRDEFRSPVPMAGTVENWIGRNVGLGYHEQAQWWQDYQGWANQIRNQLFGSALTAAESRNFDRFAISPNMTPEAIRANLARQEQVAAGGVRRLAAGYVRSGYSAEAVAGALGMDVAEVEQAARARLPDSGSDATPASGGDGGSRGAGARPAEAARSAPARPETVGNALWSPSARQWWSRDRRNAWDESGRPLVRDGRPVQ